MIKIIFYYLNENRYSFNALAGSLELDNFIVDNIDLTFVKNENELLVEIQNVFDNGEKYKNVILCISYATMQINEINKVVQQTKALLKNKILIIAGGPHPSGNPISALRNGVDIVVRGEAEEIFQLLVRKLIEGDDFYDLKNIAYLNDKQEYTFNGYENRKVDLDKYLPFSKKYKKFGPIEITRGCPFACKYCQTSFLLGNNPRHRSVQTIVENVNYMKELGLCDFRVITPNAFSYGSPDGKQLNLFALENLLFSVKTTLGAKGRIFFGSFPSEVRPEHVNEETLRIAKQYVNNDNLVIGAQSGSPRILSFINRQHTIDDIYNAVYLSIQFGFKANVDFMFGLPTESEDDIELSLKMINTIHKMGARVHGHTFMPLPQTPFKNEKGGILPQWLKKELRKLVSSGIIYGDWEKQEQFAKNRKL